MGSGRTKGNGRFNYTITFEGLLERVIHKQNINKRLKHAEIEVATIAYFGTHGNLAAAPTCMFSKMNIVTK
jgi:hypothetical protein